MIDAPQYGGLREHLVNFLGDAHVGEQHEFFHQAVRLSQLLLLDIDGIRGLRRSKVDFHFGRCEIQRAGCHTLCLELDGEGIEKANGFRDRVGAIACVTKLSAIQRMRRRHDSRVVLAHLCLLVLKCRFRSNDRLCELDVDNVGVLSELLSRRESSCARMGRSRDLPKSH
jgi:hypothetical protein